MKNYLTEDTMVICIDIWEESLFDYECMLKFLMQEHVKSIVLATYSNIKERTLEDETHWYVNRYEIFKDVYDWDRLNRHFVDVEIKNQAVQRSTNRFLKKFNRDNCQCMGLYNTWELLYVLQNRLPNIKNICFIGGNWNQCLIDRPLGWYKVSRELSEKSYRILSFSDLINHEYFEKYTSTQIIKKTPGWKQLHSGYFKYQFLNLHNTHWLDMQHIEPREYNIFSDRFKKFFR